MMRQGGQRRQSPVHSGQVVSQGGGRAHGSTFAIPIERHKPAGRLRERIIPCTVVVRSVLAKARDRGVNDVRFHLANSLVADSPFVHCSWAKILQDDLGTGGEFEKNL